MKICQPQVNDSIVVPSLLQASFFTSKSFRIDAMSGREVSIIEQVSLEPYHEDSINSSRTEIGLLSRPTFGTPVALGQGPDGKIYISKRL